MRQPPGARSWLWSSRLLIYSCLALGVSTADQLLAVPKGQSFTTRFDGDVNIGVLVNLHHGPLPNGSSDVDNQAEISQCGFINIDSMQQVIAAKWAIDVINNQSLPNELKIGLQIHDTCNRKDLTQKHLYNVIATMQELDLKVGLSENGPPLLGMIGIGEPASLSETTGALHAFNIPLVSVAPDPVDQSLGAKYSNVLTTAPDMAGQARALVNVAYEMNSDKLSILSSSRATIDTFLSEATALGIRVPHVLEYRPHDQDLPTKVESFLRKLPGKRPLVVLISEAGEAVAIAEHLKHVELPSNPIWLIGSLGLDLRTLTGWRKVFHGGYFVEPHMPELNEFKNFFISSLQNPGPKLQDLIEEYKEEMYGCAVNPLFDTSLISCNAVPKSDIELRFQQDPHVSFVVKAVSALTAAFRLVQFDYCGQTLNAACLRKIHPGLHEDILQNLRKLSFTSVPGSPMEVEGTQHHFTRNGRLVANKQLLYKIDEDEGKDQIGWYSEDEGLHLNYGIELETFRNVETTTITVAANKTETSVVKTTQLIERPQPVSSPLVVNSDRSVFGRSIGQTNIIVNNEGLFTTEVGDGDRKSPVFTYESFISRTWSLVVVAVAVIGTFACLWMLIYVFIKMCDGTLTGNQTMGILLLLGVMCLFASVTPWLLPPNEMVCANRHFLHPLAMVLCFAILLVKAMQLRSMVSVGLGGTIPHVNQLVSLIFMLLVQVVIAIEWYISSSPLGIQVNDGYPECAVSKNRFILLHVYPCTLLVLAFCYGMSVLKIKRNFNEGRWITCATAFIVPIFAAWSVVYYFAPIQYHDPSVAVSIISVAGILLSAIFFPKMHTIAKQSRMKGEDLQRSHSDSTVFTAFSDYVGKGPTLPDGIYPVYGSYYPHHSHYIPNPVKNLQPNLGPNPHMIMQHQQHNKYNSNFNGLNFVKRQHVSRNPRQPVTTYSEWTREVNPPERNAIADSVRQREGKNETKGQRRDSETSIDNANLKSQESKSRRRSKSLTRDQPEDDGSRVNQQHHIHCHNYIHHRHLDQRQMQLDEEEDENYSTVIPHQRSLSSTRNQSDNPTRVSSDGMILSPSCLNYTSVQPRRSDLVTINGRGTTGLHVGGTSSHVHRNQQFFSQYPYPQPDLYLSTAT